MRRSEGEIAELGNLFGNVCVLGVGNCVHQHHERSAWRAQSNAVCLRRSLLRDFGKGAAIASKRGFAGELLPTSNDDIYVFGFEFDQAGFPLETLAGNQGRAGTATRIEDTVAGTTAIANGSFYELNWLHSRMQIIDGGLGDRPDIALISISAPIMGPAGFPAIENRFVLTLVIGATAYRPNIRSNRVRGVKLTLDPGWICMHQSMFCW